MPAENDGEHLSHNLSLCFLIQLLFLFLKKQEITPLKTNLFRNRLNISLSWEKNSTIKQI